MNELENKAQDLITNLQTTLESIRSTCRTCKRRKGVLLQEHFPGEHGHLILLGCTEAACLEKRAVLFRYCLPPLSQQISKDLARTLWEIMNGKRELTTTGLNFLHQLLTGNRQSPSKRKLAVLLTFALEAGGVYVITPMVREREYLCGRPPVEVEHAYGFATEGLIGGTCWTACPIKQCSCGDYGFRTYFNDGEIGAQFMNKLYKSLVLNEDVVTVQDFRIKQLVINGLLGKFENETVD